MLECIGIIIGLVGLNFIAEYIHRNDIMLERIKEELKIIK